MSVLLLRRELVALMTEAPENEEPEESSAEILGGRKIHDREFPVPLYYIVWVYSCWILVNISYVEKITIFCWIEANVS